MAPAAWGRGVVFVRTDLPGEPEIPASVDHVVSTDRRTELLADGATVSTIEHVMAAVAGLGISDLMVRMSASEPPQMDGSALPFCQALIDAGLTDGAGDQPVFVVTTPIDCEHEMTRYRVLPSHEPRFTVSVEFPPPIGAQTWGYRPFSDDFTADLAGARTFGFAAELDALRRRDLIRGARTGAGFLIGDRDGEGEGGPMRWPDECARHKTLDLIGDLALLGAPVLGHIVAHRPSHRGNVGLARTVAHSCRLETASAGHP